MFFERPMRNQRNFISFIDIITIFNSNINGVVDLSIYVMVYSSIFNIMFRRTYV